MKTILTNKKNLKGISIWTSNYSESKLLSSVFFVCFLLHAEISIFECSAGSAKFYTFPFWTLDAWKSEKKSPNSITIKTLRQCQYCLTECIVHERTNEGESEQASEWMYKYWLFSPHVCAQQSLCFVCVQCSYTYTYTITIVGSYRVNSTQHNTTHIFFSLSHSTHKFVFHDLLLYCE